MSFAEPWFLFVIIPFVFLLFFLKRIERKNSLDIATGLIVRRLGSVKSFFKKSGRVMWISAAFLLVGALARPQTVSEGRSINIEGRMMILSVDLSYSMSGTTRSKTGRPAVDVIKELSVEFVKKRATTDFVGITAYGGKATGRKSGESAVIVFPTFEYAQLEASIKLLEPRMLGSYTSIGEGIFISILSLIEPSVIQAIKKENADYINDLTESIEAEDKTFALNFVKRVGYFRNQVIVLFTDGKNNAGIEPKYPLWLCKMLGIKVYFGALESTGATGLSSGEEIRQKNLLIEGTLATGGKYFEMQVTEQARKFYEEIDRLETARLEFENVEFKKSVAFMPVFIALILIGLVIVFENIFPRV